MSFLSRMVTFLALSFVLALGTAARADDNNETHYQQWERENASASKAYDDGRWGESLSLYQTALSTAEKLTYGGPKAISYYGIAKSYHKDRKLTEAEENYKKALEIFDGSTRRVSSYLLSCVKDYASLLRELGRNSEAEEQEARLKPKNNN